MYVKSNLTQKGVKKLNEKLTILLHFDSEFRNNVFIHVRRTPGTALFTFNKGSENRKKKYYSYQLVFTLISGNENGNSSENFLELCD